MTYRDIILRMESRGDYYEAERFQRIIEDHGHHEYDHADRWNPADGAQHTRPGDLAEEAACSIQYDEDAERLREEREEEVRDARRRLEAEWRRHEEEEYWASQQPPEPEPQREPEPEPPCAKEASE